MTKRIENTKQVSLFIHKFRTSRYFYIYDVPSNQILRVDPEIYNLINEDGLNTEVTKIIEHARNTLGIFYPSPLKGLKFPQDREIKKQLESGLQQLILNVTEDCNMRCKYCKASGAYFYERPHSPRYMTPNIAEKAIDFFITHSSKSQRRSISFFGGEPLLNFNLIKRSVEYAISQTGEKNMHFSLTTNGTLLSDDIIDFLVRHNFSLYISLDGPKDIHNKNRVFKNGKGTFDKIIENLQKIKRKSEEYFYSNIGINATLTPPWEIDKIKSFF